MEEAIAVKQKTYSGWAPFLFALPGMLLWNALDTYWIYNSTAVGGIVAIALNSLFMAFVIQIYHLIRKNVFRFKGGYWILPVAWMAFEYLHLNWSLNWPWLNIGNGFSMYPRWIQWYEYTGTFGGTLWVFVVNLLLFTALRSLFSGRKGYNPLWIVAMALLVFAVPVFLSHRMYHAYEEREDPLDILVIQPNNDPYTEQYGLSPDEVLSNVYDLIDTHGDSLVDFIVLPESVIQEGSLFERKLTESRSVRSLLDYMSQYPQTAICIGASTYKRFLPGETLTSTARLVPNADWYYDAYNTVFYMDNISEIQLYHKSKLTPGVEVMPLIEYLPFIEHLALDLGGTVGSLGIDRERKPFYNTLHEVSVAPCICYESIFGEFLSGFVRNGAEAIFVMTNDGWWKDTPGYRQHASYARLRAIEMRRSIARSANTGTSCFINQRGDVIKATPYWERTAIRHTINANDRITFYAQHGDYIARVAVLTFLIMLLASVARGIVMRSGK